MAALCCLPHAELRVALCDTAQAFHLTSVKEPRLWGKRARSGADSGIQGTNTGVSLAASAGTMLTSPRSCFGGGGGGVWDHAVFSSSADFVFHGSQMRPGDLLHGADRLSLSPQVPDHGTQHAWGSWVLLGTRLMFSEKEEGAVAGSGFLRVPRWVSLPSPPLSDMVCVLFVSLAPAPAPVAATSLRSSGREGW